MQQASPHDVQRAESPLTSSADIFLDHFAVPDHLAPFVIALYHFTCDQDRLVDVVPAGVGYVMALLIGRAEATFADGHVAGSYPVSLLTPTSGAAQVVADGPLHLVGIALSPLGWAALTGKPAYECRNRLLDAAEALGPEIGRAAESWRAAYAEGRLSGAEIAAQLARTLVPDPGRLAPRHIALLREVGDWLSSSFDPPLEELGRQSGYSERQVERLVKRYFGATPHELVRKYRALRVAAMLQAPDCDDEQAAQLVDLFYDQSHMIREMRHFLGRTPLRLADNESPLTEAMNGIDNFRRRTPSFARLPGIEKGGAGD